MPLGVIRSIVSRRYSDFRGIDLLNADTSVDFRRSPDCLNVWKSYNLEQSNIIQTRPGIINVMDLSDEYALNNKIYSIYIWDTDTAIVHIGKRLLKWDGFPDEESSTVTELTALMNEQESIMVYFGDKLYILDGIHYFSFNGTTLESVETSAYTPTTTISRSPAGRRRNVRRS